MEEEVFKSPRGGHQAPEPQDVQNEARVGPKTVPEEDVRDSGEVRLRKCRDLTELLVGNNITKYLKQL